MNGKIPKIISGESLSSFIYRLCKAFHFDSCFSFVSHWNMSEEKLKKNEFSVKEIELISEFSDQNKEMLYEMTGDNWREIWGAGYYNKLILKNKIKYCPCCVRNEIVHKKNWTILPVAICPEHKIFLIDRCQGCNCFISMDNFMFGFCLNCSFKFSQATIQIVDEKSIFFESQIYLIQKISNTTCIVSNEEFLKRFSSLEIFALSFCSFYLLSGLKSFIDSGSEFISPFSNGKDKLKNQINAATAFGNVFWILHEFPKNFIQVLEAFHSNKEKIIYLQKPRFEKLFKLKKFEFIHKAYNEFWIGKFNNGQIRKDFSVFKIDKSLINQAQMLRKDEIKNRFKVTYNAIGKMNQIGLIQAKYIRRGKNIRYLIDRASLEAALQLNRLYITKCDAAEILGVQKDSIPKLINAGLLKIKESPTKQAMIFKPDVENLLSRSRGGLVDGEIQGIQFHKALIKYSVNGLSIAKLLNFTEIGVLHPMTNITNGTLANTFYSEIELEECMSFLKKEKQNQHGYYLQDVMQLLHIGEKSLNNLMKLGVISPQREFTMKDGRKHLFFEKNRIDTFIKGHLTVEEAAQKFQISSSTIRRYLKSGKLNDAMKGACKNYLISIEELSLVAAAK
ncbi:TniQ family protein [Paenibacillus sp. Soil724D2]|uniref:TniQ family protein n=1 Tax=Paenibacillus sp. (strain Soil724D2) TaxID=1736392 RepID=UPI00071575C9|nr:TniQ family protein [Paenibacillus sp. Soil724D2]KRE48393.1 hypothetical protein ASG85_05160 [Paenibacillus sp. Soil724D2]